LRAKVLDAAHRVLALDGFRYLSLFASDDFRRFPATLLGRPHSGAAADWNQLRVSRPSLRQAGRPASCRQGIVVPGLARLRSVADIGVVFFSAPAASSPFCSLALPLSVFSFMNGTLPRTVEFPAGRSARCRKSGHQSLHQNLSDEGTSGCTEDTPGNGPKRGLQIRRLPLLRPRKLPDRCNVHPRPDAPAGCSERSRKDSAFVDL